MQPRLLLLETSNAAGVVALAEGEQLLASRTLEDSRRHARDLAPTVRELFTAHGWQPRDVTAIVVGRGPGSYTGLRVGLMSAKAFAYATSSAIVALDTFAVLAHQTSKAAGAVHVIADAQQDNIYVQPFLRTGAACEAFGPLVIQSVSIWLADLPDSTLVTGPGLRKHRGRLTAGQPIADETTWAPSAAALLKLGLAKFEAGELADLWALEPLYLRPSSAEEQWARKISNSK